MKSLAAILYLLLTQIASSPLFDFATMGEVFIKEIPK